MNEHTFFEWKRSERLTAVLALVFCLLGLGLQRLPGVGFSGKLSWGLALVCLVLLGLSRLSRRHRGWKILLRIAQIGLAALVLGLSAVEIWVIRAGHRDESAQPADAVIVLGAGVRKLRTGREHQHWDGFPRLPQRPQDGKSVLLRQHHI